MFSFHFFRNTVFAVFVLFLILLQPHSATAQISYENEDTVRNKVQLIYDKPHRVLYQLSAGVNGELPGIGSGVPFLSGWAMASVEPIKFISATAYYEPFLLLTSAIQEMRPASVYGGRVNFYVRNFDLARPKFFTAGTGAYNYSFNVPMKVRWKMGFTAGLESGSRVFVNGDDPNTDIRFKSQGMDSSVYLPNVVVRQQGRTYSAGLVVGTRANFKIRANLPGGTKKIRRIHFYTEFRAELLYSRDMKAEESIEVHDFDRLTNYRTWQVAPGAMAKTGWRMSFYARRKLAAIRVEAGARPGINYRFSNSEQDNLFNRFYILAGIGLGWM